MPVNALHRAVREPTPAAVLTAIYAALDAGGDVNGLDLFGRTPLRWAVENPVAAAATAAVQVLAAAAADVQAKDSRGAEPLHAAAYNQNVEAVNAAPTSGSLPPCSQG